MWHRSPRCASARYISEICATIRTINLRFLECGGCTRLCESRRPGSIPGGNTEDIMFAMFELFFGAGASWLGDRLQPCLSGFDSHRRLSRKSFDDLDDLNQISSKLSVLCRADGATHALVRLCCCVPCNGIFDEATPPLVSSGGRASDC